jgi:hypothetical protein
MGCASSPLKIPKAGLSRLQSGSIRQIQKTPKGTEDHGAVCPVSSVPVLAEV